VEPAVAQARRIEIGALPEARRRPRRAHADLAHLAGRRVATVVGADPYLRECGALPPDRAQAFAFGLERRHVFLRRHPGIEAVRLGLSKARVEDGPEALQGPPGQGRGGGGGGVEHNAQARQVRPYGVGMVEQHSQERRDHEQHRNAVLGDGAEHGLRVRSGEDHEGRAGDPAGVHRATAEVAQRELAEQPVPGLDAESARPRPHCRSRAGIAVGHSLGMPGGPGGVEDLRQRGGRAIDAEGLRRLGIGERRDVRGSLGASQHQHRRAPGGGGARPRCRRGRECDDETRFGVAQHEGVLALGESAQHGDERSTRPGDRDHGLHVLDAVLLHDGHPLPRPQPEANEGPSQARRSLVELAEAAAALPVDHGDAIGPAPGGARRVVRVGVDHRRGPRRSGGR
jgi:hypothetical protein